MAHSSADRDSKATPTVSPGRGPSGSAPRWVKVFGAIAVLLVLLVAVHVMTGGMAHHDMPFGPEAHGR